MKKLLVSTLSLILLFTGQDHFLINTAAEEPEAAEMPAETPASEQEEGGAVEEQPVETKEEEETPAEETPAETPETAPAPEETETPEETAMPEETAAPEETAVPEETPESSESAEGESTALDAEALEEDDEEEDEYYLIDYEFCNDLYFTQNATWMLEGEDAPRQVTSNLVIGDRNYSVNEKYKCPNSKPVCPGLEFQGWSRTKGGPVEFKPGSTYPSLGQKEGVLVYLYAVWKPKTYSVKFALNGGTFRDAFDASISYDFYMSESEEEGTDYTPYSTNGNYAAQYIDGVIRAHVYDDNLTKPGFEFDGFYTDKGFTKPYLTANGIPDLGYQEDRFDNAFYMSKDPGNYTLYAKWKPIEYPVKYEFNGGQGEEDPAVYVTGTKVKLPKPTKEGSTFVGWYLNEYFLGDKITELSDKINPDEDGDGNLNLYARWSTPDSFKLAYNLNGGKGKMETAPIQLDAEDVILRMPPERPGYEFDCWSRDKKGEDRIEKDRVTPEELNPVKGKTVTLYAQWEKVDYFIHYELNGGTNNIANPPFFNAAGKNVSLKNPSREGYVFDGWFESEYFFGKKITSINKDSARDYTIYAKWSPAQYTLAYNANGQKISLPGKAKHALLEDVELAKVPEIPGYEFLGWNTKKNGTGIQLESDQEFAVGYDLGAKQGSAVTLYAQWKAEKYNIAYELNGGTDPGNPVSYKSDKGASLKKPKKDGYNFVGWYGDEHFTGTKISKINKGTSGDLTLYALWADKNNKDTFRIAYNLNGLKGSLETTTAGLGEGDYVFLKYPPERKGYEFVCWKDVTGENYFYPNEMIMNPANEFGGEKGKTVTLIAEWKQKTYDIKFYANAKNAFFTDKQISDNYMRPMEDYEAFEYVPAHTWEVTTGNAMLKMIHTYDNLVSINVAPVRPGYKLAGWSRDPNATKAEFLLGKRYSNFNPEEKDCVELFAVWK